jgi:hypothetical protein
METIVSIFMLIGMMGVLGYLYLKLRRSRRIANAGYFLAV